MPIIAHPSNINNEDETNKFYRKTNSLNNQGSTSIGNILFILFFCLKLSYDFNDKCYCNSINKWCSKKMENINQSKTIFRNINTTKVKFKNKFTKLDLKKIENLNYDFHKYPDIKKILNEGLVVENTIIPWFLPLEYVKKIQKIFQPDNENLKYIYSKYKKYLDKNTCSIHYRTYNKDFDTDHNKKQLKSKSETLKKVIDINFHSIDYFLVFSDDMVYTKKFIKSNFKENKFIFINERDFIDIWIMSLCKNNIGFYESSFFICSVLLNKNKNKKVHAIKRLNLNPKKKVNLIKNNINNYNFDNVVKYYKWNIYNWEFDN
tara:strand:- start:976 stop:1932 length:957 start_codon:yes stop_codon:yes gene_type:complete